MPERRRGRSSTKAGARTRPSAETLERRLRRAEAALEAERRRHARQIAAVRRGADRRLAAMLREIAGLRHHEARTAALERIVAEREEALRAQEERLAELERLHVQAR